MEINFARLAERIAEILVPYLLEGEQSFADQAGKKLTEQLWKTLKPKVEAKESAKEAMQDVIDTPDDQGAQASFEHQIKKILADYPNLAAEISLSLMEKSIFIGGDLENSNVVIGSNNTVIVNKTPSRDEANAIYRAFIANKTKGKFHKAPSHDEALTIYRAFMANKTKSLSLHGIDVRASDPSTQISMGLANIYVELETTTPAPAKLIISDETSKQDSSVKYGFHGTVKNSLSALEALIQNKRLVIKGDPGSGKSTFINYIIYCLSTESIDRLAGWKKEDSDILPVLVILRDFVRTFKRLPPQAEPKHIWDFIEKRLKDQNLSTASKPIQDLLEHGKIILFLDGLDEVSTIKHRVFVRDAVTAFYKRYPKNRFVVTCRILSYQPPKTEHEVDLRLTAFPEFELASFDYKKINSLIDAWYRELTNLGSLTLQDAHNLNNGLKTALRRVELRRLASNPLLLTVMAVVNTHKAKLPEARSVLYQMTVEILLWQWEQVSKGQEANLRKLLLEADCTEIDLEQVIWKLAYEAHAQTNKNDHDETLAGISELNLQQALAGINKGDRNWAADMIETMKLRAGLLLERENNIFTFPHRSFQEFLAATYIESNDDFVSHAKDLANKPMLWRQTILWAVSRRVHIRGPIDGPLSLITELFPTNAPKDELYWSKVWLAGDILLEIGLNRLNNSQQGKNLLPRIQNHLNELIEQGHLTSRERAEASNTLAKLGDSRVGVVKDFVFCEIPAGKFLMGSSKKNDRDAYNCEEPQFEYYIKNNYFISRYPVTNAQFELYVEDPLGYSNEIWYTDKGKIELQRVKKERPLKQGAVFDLPNHPIVNVTWYEAVAFTRWLTNKLRNERLKAKLWEGNTIRQVSIDFSKWEARLPVEAEWEKAARGTHGLRYPWGNEISPNQANYFESHLGTTSTVGCFPSGQSPYGLLDMSGNIWEWCATQWTDNYKNYKANENNDFEGSSSRIMRGGAFFSDGRFARCAFRFRDHPFESYFNVGFRVVLAPKVWQTDAITLSGSSS